MELDSQAGSLSDGGRYLGGVLGRPPVYEPFLEVQKLGPGAHVDRIFFSRASPARPSDTK